MPQTSQVVLDRRAQLVRALAREPAALVVAEGADLGHQHQAVGVGVQRLADQLIRNVGSVVLSCVDVVDAQLDGAPQNSNGLVVVARRPHDAGAGELHRTEPDAVHSEGAKRVSVHTSTLPVDGAFLSGIATSRMRYRLDATRSGPVRTG